MDSDLTKYRLNKFLIFISTRMKRPSCYKMNETVIFQHQKNIFYTLNLIINYNIRRFFAIE